MPLPETDLTRSPSWEETVETYREELGGGDDYDSIIENGSLGGLINHVQTLWPGKQSERTALNPMSQLRPIVKFFNDFSELTAVYFNADTEPASLVWGSIQIILTTASTDATSLQDVLDMLEELSLVLPRFKAYEEILPTDANLQSSLLIIYNEFCCFCARAVNVLRRGNHLFLRQKQWADFQADFGRTIKRIKLLCSNVESEADIVAMQFERRKYFDALMSREYTMKKNPSLARESCHFLPLSVDSRFWGREDALEQVDKALFSDIEEVTPVRSFALHGMGGVGKTQVALKYTEQAREKFKTILWVTADSIDALGQSFREIARHCGLLESNEEVDYSMAMLRVKSWLQERDHPWLLVFDNAGNIGILKHAWPVFESLGSVLVTTRDFNAAFEPALGGFQVEPFDDITGSTLLLNILGLDQDSISNVEKAKEISFALGGHPLAINQIGRFIHLRKIPLQNFLPLYQRRSTDIDSRRTVSTEYNHTLSMVWEVSLERLSGDSKTLQMLLALFDPQCIHESLLLAGSKNVRDQDFGFLENELDLLDAEIELLRSALIDKTDDGEGKLSIHKLIQTAVMRRMSADERSKCFDVAINIISSWVPDAYRGSASKWTKSDDCVPHLDNLIKMSKAYNIHPKDRQAFAELLFRCSWFLYDMGDRERAGDFIKLALNNFSDRSSSVYASATDLLELIEPNIAQRGI